MLFVVLCFVTLAVDTSLLQSVTTEDNANDFFLFQSTPASKPKPNASLDPSDQQSLIAELKKENEELKKKLTKVEESFQPIQEKIWTLLFFRWLSMIKFEIEWLESTETNFTLNFTIYAEEMKENKYWSEDEEYHRQLWMQIFNRSEHTFVKILLHKINEDGIPLPDFCRNIAFAYKQIKSKLLSMLRWRNLPKFEKEPTFNTPITWNTEADKCLATLMHDYNADLVWNFKTELQGEHSGHTMMPEI